MYPTKKPRTKKWSQEVTRHSRALDLEPGVFTWKDPHQIAASLLRSALRSTRRKGTAYQSAMSMLNFYINRAGKNLTADRKKILAKAKAKLRDLAEPREARSEKGGKSGTGHSCVTVA